MGNEKKDRSQLTVLLGAAFLMAISAIGPGFLTQTANFTASLKGNFGFVILITLVFALVVQLNVWRVIGVSGLRAQDIANKVLPGLGYFVALLIALGGFAFNIGNIGGTALGFNALADIPLRFGQILSGLLAILVFISRNAKSIIDRLVQVLTVVMIIITLIVAVISRPPVAEAALRTLAPDVPLSAMFFPILTLLGGTVGGYITFAGGHRLIDAGISGKANLKKITQSAVLGIGVATIMRIVLFLAVLGVVSTLGKTLAPVAGAPANPAAMAFYHAVGTVGFRFFGVLLLLAGVTSVIGAAYTSISFLKTLFKRIADHERYFTIAFIALSTIVMSLVGSPAMLLVVVGFLNGLILPVTLTVMLIASRRKDIIGEDYRHPLWLTVLGVIIVGATIYLSITGFPGLISTLFGA